MNILVTGGNGQLGRCIDKISSEYNGCNFIFSDLPESDITDFASMAQLVRACGAEVIINCAAHTLAEKAEAEGVYDAISTNIKGAGVLADVAAELGCVLIHISTDYVFGGELSRPLTEEDRTNPLSVYGLTKLASERMVLASRANAAVVRTSWLYSEFGSNFMKTMLRLAQTRDKVSVVSDQIGCPTYAVDLARAVMVLVLRGVVGRELYHFSNLGEVSWSGFAQEIFKQSALSTTVEAITSTEYPSAVKRPVYSVLNTSKICSVGVIVPEWKEALSRCLAEIK